MRLPLWLLCVLLVIPAAAQAQVGYPPEHSPYRDIPSGHTFTVTLGHLGGSGGRFGIGPHSATMYGARYDIRTGNLLSIGLAAAHGTADRLIVNPFVKLANRTTGPVNQSLTLAEGDLIFNLTGRKTWHGLAPLIAFGGGVAVAARTPADTSGFLFHNKFYFSPQLALRVFLTRHLQLRGSVQGIWWKLRYPVSFQQEPVEEPGTAAKPNAVIPDGKVSQWTGSIMLQAGVGYTFHW